jgi:hypothetical protein
VERWKESKSNRADTAALAEIRLRSYSNPMARQENKKKRKRLFLKSPQDAQAGLLLHQEQEGDRKEALKFDNCFFFFSV